MDPLLMRKQAYVYFLSYTVVGAPRNVIFLPSFFDRFGAEATVVSILFAQV